MHQGDAHAVGVCAGRQERGRGPVLDGEPVQTLLLPRFLLALGWLVAGLDRREWG